MRRVFGTPESVTTYDHPFDVGAKFTQWHYSGLVVDLEPYAGKVHGLTLTGQRFATPRGLHVGDDAMRIRSLYGPPRDTTQGDWEFPDSRPDAELHVIRVSFVAGRVTSIYLGWLVD